MRGEVKRTSKIAYSVCVWVQMKVCIILLLSQYIFNTTYIMESEIVCVCLCACTCVCFSSCKSQ